ncbi:hypothetical protein VC83_06631 [Pseudogymnoascus destructans]|uniref:Uncharacterized protein n=2 Tax=Pseudogymnoascus destructans TaxID=655981 RepID=L8FNJ2_PSED2|nr:uncharacterized protein VC83_06631 [Pseudogymnoascus destructans]ELR02089.1 hypothetical protein GMDG_05249 [Pseudogymnoascus destructans 20631-21]OAF56331.1 hypothetical protein VC83_06631 [Pseudogymnoascus destructans]
MVPGGGLEVERYELPRVGEDELDTAAASPAGSFWRTAAPLVFEEAMRAASDKTWSLAAMLSTVSLQIRHAGKVDICTVLAPRGALLDSHRLPIGPKIRDNLSLGI